MYRVEDKYRMSESDLYLLQSRLKIVLDTDANAADGYTITSVYFDDLFDSHLQDTIDGNRMREKYSIRIYNGSFDIIKLEVKYKRNNRVKKQSARITYEQMCALMDGRCIEDEESSLDSPITLFNTAIRKRGLRPKVIVEYDRTAYVFEPGNVRITLDRNLRASDQMEVFERGGKLYYEYPQEPGRVLEVKYDEFLPGFIAGILELGNMNQTSYSKYRLCREIKGE